MKPAGLTSVELAFLKRSGRKEITTATPYIVVQNFPNLGLLTSLRFLEWVAENPEGVISLPTGKTPEYFIKWTNRILTDWKKAPIRKLIDENGMKLSRKPSLKGLHFVQIDEFYPINPKQHNSFYDYVMNYYIKGFGLDPERALLINSDKIKLAEGLSYTEVFPTTDRPTLHSELPRAGKAQQPSLFMIDNSARI